TKSPISIPTLSLFPKFLKVSWWLVALILFCGWVLVFLEIFIIPGTTLFAIAGIITMITGVVFAFNQYGIIVGTLTLFGSALFTFLSVIYGFKRGLLRGLTQKGIVDGKMNLIDEEKIKEGDVGIALSKIAPIGKALFNDNNFEVQSLGEWIVEGSKIEVTKISLNKIIVKAKT
ncbi:MAG: hypothetical protein LH473_10890, partial [Chitinophagales bacterium]|nr:hypothetical protein [Chitinophagales bacterium]